MRVGIVIAACLLFFTGQALAWHTEGCIYCDDNGNGQVDADDPTLSGVRVIVTNKDGSFTTDGYTDQNGCFYIQLPDIADCYVQTIDETTLPDGAVILDPNGGILEYCLDEGPPSWAMAIYDYLVDCNAEEHHACWLTGGGVKFCSLTGTSLAEHGPQHNLGGNVFPSCDPDPGDGGNWNHIAHSLKLHFQGKVVEDVRCGNVADIEPGSESPVTPFNFIEFWGTGTLKGIKGNKVSHDLVYFFARCEDRNEPGSNGAKDGADVDRYFLHVFSDPSDPAGSTLLLIDIDGDPETVDPITITGGNLQIHISSCDDPPSWAN